MQRVREEVAKDGDKQANKEVVEEVDKKVVEELETHRHCPATFSQTRILGLLVGVVEGVEFSYNITILSLCPSKCRKSKTFLWMSTDAKLANSLPTKVPPCPRLFPPKSPPRKLAAAGFTGAANISPIFHNLGPA